MRPSEYRFCNAVLALGLLASVFSVPACLGQSPRNRIALAIDDEQRSVLPGSLSPQTRVGADAGEVSAAQTLNGMTLSFAPSASQQADLDALLAAQGNPASPQFHQWLTPEQFGARFGMSDADLAKVEAWLQEQGFTVNSVARARNRITFSGTAGQAAAAFRAPLHVYRQGSDTNFAPSANLSLPSAFASMVAGVGNLSSFRPRPHVRLKTPAEYGVRFTSAQTGNHFLTPKDVATLYDVTPAYNAGYTGAGQAIAIVGQSSILTTDIANFQKAAGLAVSAPTFVLVPNSGTPTVYTADEGESDLDVEYSGAMAPGANLLFVYAGNSANYDVFDALSYAIGERLAPVISMSYGLCEAAQSTATLSTRNGLLAQGAAQGQTIVVASGDSGSTDCYGVTTLSTAVQQAVAVDFPSSSPYVTSLGGTEFSAANSAAANSTYWSNAAGIDVIGSALSYIPEQVWNDDSSNSGTLGLSASGGGTSAQIARPTWQAGVPGIPAGTNRLVPDVSLVSSPVNVGYLYCSSDSSTGVSGSCSNGFRDVNNTTLTIAGGTSFAAPIFAGMVALINQSRNSTGQGLINPTLYTLASNPTTYASAFHDVTSGTNGCTAGVTGCTAASAASYAATTGYDQATGLGSVDFYKLLTAWPAGTAGAVATTVTLSAATTTPAVSTADLITIKVAASSSATSPAPTGAVTLLIDGASPATQLTISGGNTTYSFSSAIAGTHTLVATYSGDTNYAPSASTLILTVGTPASTAAFSLSVPTITVAAGSSGTAMVRLTGSNGYNGTVSWSLGARSSVANFCYSISNVSLAPGASLASTTLTIYTSSASCSSTTIKGVKSPSLVASNTPRSAGATDRTGATDRSRTTDRTGEAALALASVCGLLLLGRRSKRLRPLLAFTVLLGMGAALSGCGNSSSSSSTVTSTTAFTAKGSYSFTLTGTDTASSALNSSTTFTLTVN